MAKTNSEGDIHIKITTAGHLSSGKTSLVMRFVMGEFPMNTINTITTTNLSKNLVWDNKKISLNFEDTAGDPRFHEIAICCFPRTNYAIVCYDLSKTNGWNDAKEWIRKIREISECRLILCGTKNDLLKENDDRDVRQTVVENYSEGLLMDYFEVSAKSGDGIDGLFNYIIKDYMERRQKIIQLKNVQDENELKNENRRLFCTKCEKCILS